MAKAHVKMSTNFNVLIPEKEDAISIPVSQWNRFIQKIEGCVDHSSTYRAFGWGCVGFAGSAFLAAITFPCSVDFSTLVSNREILNWPAYITESICVISAVFGGLLGWITLAYAKQHHNDKAKLQTQVTDDMRYFAENHRPVVSDDPDSEPAVARSK